MMSYVEFSAKAFPASRALPSGTRLPVTDTTGCTVRAAGVRLWGTPKVRMYTLEKAGSIESHAHHQHPAKAVPGRGLTADD